MPTYEVTSPEGITLELEGEKPPTKQQLDKIFENYKSQNNIQPVAKQNKPSPYQETFNESPMVSGKEEFNRRLGNEFTAGMDKFLGGANPITATTGLLFGTKTPEEQINEARARREKAMQAGKSNSQFVAEEILGGVGEAVAIAGRALPWLVAPASIATIGVKSAVPFVRAGLTSEAAGIAALATNKAVNTAKSLIGTASIVAIVGASNALEKAGEGKFNEVIPATGSGMLTTLIIDAGLKGGARAVKAGTEALAKPIYKAIEAGKLIGKAEEVGRIAKNGYEDWKDKVNTVMALTKKGIQRSRDYLSDLSAQKVIGKKTARDTTAQEINKVRSQIQQLKEGQSVLLSEATEAKIKQSGLSAKNTEDAITALNEDIDSKAFKLSKQMAGKTKAIKDSISNEYNQYFAENNKEINFYSPNPESTMPEVTNLFLEDNLNDSVKALTAKLKPFVTDPVKRARFAETIMGVNRTVSGRDAHEIKQILRKMGSSLAKDGVNHNTGMALLNKVDDIEKNISSQLGKEYEALTDKSRNMFQLEDNLDNYLGAEKLITIREKARTKTEGISKSVETYLEKGYDLGSEEIKGRFKDIQAIKDSIEMLKGQGLTDYAMSLEIGMNDIVSSVIKKNQVLKDIAILEKEFGVKFIDDKKMLMKNIENIRQNGYREILDVENRVAKLGLEAKNEIAKMSAKEEFFRATDAEQARTLQLIERDAEEKIRILRHSNRKHDKFTVIEANIAGRAIGNVLRPVPFGIAVNFINPLLGTLTSLYILKRYHPELGYLLNETLNHAERTFANKYSGAVSQRIANNFYKWLSMYRDDYNKE